jgi:uncharacterized membrane protein
MDALTSRFGNRFLIVSVLPNAMLIAYLGLLVAAGAPTRDPAISRAIKILNGLTIRQVVALVLGLLIFSVATYSLQVPLIQLLEGYWQRLPMGRTTANRCIDRMWTERQQLADFINKNSRDEVSDETARQIAEAQYRIDWIPPDKQFVLPTELGNVLYVGETTAASRYGLETNVVMARLRPLLSADMRAELGDKRSQMDAAARLCIVAGVATMATIGLLLSRGPWLFLAFAPYLLSWVCYRAAVAGAHDFSRTLAAAIDLYHLELFDALHLPRPENLTRELEVNELLGYLFSGDNLGPADTDHLTYVTSKKPQMPSS